MNLEKILSRTGLGKLVSASTFKNISTLMVGTLLSAAIPILFSPVMARIFTTSDYGVLGLYMGVSGLLGVLAYAHYPQAIMLEKDDAQARQVLWFTLALCGAFAILVLLVMLGLLFFTDIIASSQIGKWYFFIPASIFLNGASAVLMIWANRHQQYKTLAFNRIIQAAITVVIQISLGLLFKNEMGLMVGLIFGQLLSVVLLIISTKKRPDVRLGMPKSTEFKRLALKHKNLLLYTTPSEFINNLINQTPIFLLQKFGGVSYVGSYNFTQRFLGIPQQFLSSAIVEVFKQKASASYNKEGNCIEVFLKTFKILTLLAIVPFGLIILFAPPVFAFVFGPQWREAGVFAQFLGILFFFRFIVSPLTYVYIIAGKLKEDFWLHILFLVVTTAAFYIGNAIFENKTNLILIYALTYSSVYIIYFIRSFQFSKGKL